MPPAAALPLTGLWVLPHAHLEDAVGGSFTSDYYIGDNESAILDDSFYADSAADSAHVQVDLYNPTDATLANAQLFAAVSDGSLFEAIEFSGGVGGDVTITGLDELSAGTPSELDAHDVYPAYFASYAVGDVAPGSSGVLTVWVNVTGDFAGGLVVHLDYTAEDASGAAVTGPFEADMNIFEAGEVACELATFSIDHDGYLESPAAGEVVEDRITITQTGGDAATEIGLLVTQAWIITHEIGHSLGASHEVDGASFAGPAPTGWTRNITVRVNVSPPLIAGDLLRIGAELTWTACDGSDGQASSALDLEIAAAGSWEPRGVGYWKEQYRRAESGRGHLDYSAEALTGFLKSAALHSELLSYGPSEGEGPDGIEDAGWVEVGSLSDAFEVLSAGGSAADRTARADFALWLNAAAGLVTLDAPLEVAAGAGGATSPFEDETGLASLPSDLDTAREILAFSLDVLSGGASASNGDLELAKALCESVNEGWLVPA